MDSSKQMVAGSLFTFTLSLSFWLSCCSPLSCNAPEASIIDMSAFGSPILSHVLLSPGRSNIQRTFPNDIHGSRCNWIEGYGQLTRLGKRDQYELGEWLRKRYGDLADKMFVCSVDSDKALSSAQATLAALSAPAKEKDTDGLSWQPFPIYTVQRVYDKILEGKPCPKYDAALELYLNSPLVGDVDHENKDLYRTLTNVTGMQIGNIQDVAEIYEILEILSLRNMTLPEWSENLFPGELLRFSVYKNLIPTSTEELKRLRTGPLLEEIASHIKDKMNESINMNTNLFVYSGEKDTISAVLNSLGVFNCLPPPDSATLLIELWTAQELCVTVSYKNESRGEAYILSLPGCEPLCPFDDFLLLLENSIPQNWTEECSVLGEGLDTETILLRVTCALLAMVMIAMLVIMILCLRQRDDI